MVVECAHDSMVDTATLVPNPRNPNKHPQKQIELLAKIIKHTGWRNPIVVSNRSGFIVKGHARLEAAKLLKEDKVPVDYQDYENEAMEWADLIADNRLAELSEPSLPELKDLLESLDTGAFDMDLTGFDSKALEELMTQTFQPTDGLTDDDAIPEPKETICKAGDLWLLGRHRLLCGDSTKAEDVARLMNGEKAALCFTSPPYADLREYGIGDFDWLPLMNGAWDGMAQHCKDDAHILVNLGLVHKDRRVVPYWEKWLVHAEESGWPLYGWYVWDKGFGLCGEWNGRLAPCHEFVFHFNNKAGTVRKWQESITDPVKAKKKISHTFRQRDGSLRSATSPDKIGQASRIPDSVIRVTKETHNVSGHPAPYPVEFVAFGLQTWSLAEDAIHDPFLGSGTTLIACEKLNRRCFGMEIDAHYCDVIIKRFEDYTGEKAQRG